MNIPPSILLISGSVALALYLIVFTVSLIVTMRNRRIMQRCKDAGRISQPAGSEPAGKQ